MINFNEKFVIILSSADHVVPITDLLSDLGYTWRGGESLKSRNIINWNRNGIDNVLCYTPTPTRQAFTKSSLQNAEFEAQNRPSHKSGIFYSEVRKGEYAAFNGPEQVRVVDFGEEAVQNRPRKMAQVNLNKALNKEPILDLKNARRFYSSDNDLLKKVARLHFSEDTLEPVSLERLASALKDANIQGMPMITKCFDPIINQKLLLRVRLMNLCHLLYGERASIPVEAKVFMPTPEYGTIQIVYTYTMNNPICFDSTEDAEMILGLLTDEDKKLMLSGF